VLYRAVAEVLAWLYRIERGERADAPVAEGLPESLRGLTDEDRPA
jgi:hypothetical protein